MMTPKPIRPKLRTKLTRNGKIMGRPVGRDRDGIRPMPDPTAIPEISTFDIAIGVLSQSRTNYAAQLSARLDAKSQQKRGTMRWAKKISRARKKMRTAGLLKS